MCVRCGRHAAGAPRGPVVYTLEFIALAWSGDSGREQREEGDEELEAEERQEGERKSELSYESA